MILDVKSRRATESCLECCEESCRDSWLEVRSVQERPSRGGKDWSKSFSVQFKFHAACRQGVRAVVPSRTAAGSAANLCSTGWLETSPERESDSR